MVMILIFQDEDGANPDTSGGDAPTKKMKE